jgi:hypothetical protein
MSAHAYAPKSRKKSNARKSSMERFKLGAQGGANATRYIQGEKGALEDENLGFADKLALAFQGGVFGEYKFINELGLRLDTMYAGQGHRTKANDGKAIKFNQHYIVGSLTARYYPISNMPLAILVGPYGGYLLSAKTNSSKFLFDISDDDTDDTANKDNVDTDIKEHVNSIDFGMVSGIDYEFNFGLAVGLKTNIGLRRIYKQELFKNKNFGVGLVIGYNFAKLI